MFPDYDSSFLKSLLEENSWNLNKALESMLLFSFLAHEPADETTPPSSVEVDSIWNEKPPSTDPNNAPSSPLTSSAERFYLDNQLSQQQRDALEGLVDMFPFISRSVLSVYLAENDWDASRTTTAILEREESEKAAAEATMPEVSQKRNKVEWTRLQEFILPSNSSARAPARPLTSPWGHSARPCQRSIKYSPLPTAQNAPKPAKAHPAAASTTASLLSSVPNRLRFDALRRQVPWVDPEILESLFCFNGCSMTATVKALSEIYPAAAMSAQQLPDADSSCRTPSQPENQPPAEVVPPPATVGSLVASEVPRPQLQEVPQANFSSLLPRVVMAYMNPHSRGVLRSL